MTAPKPTAKRRAPAAAHAAAPTGNPILVEVTRGAMVESRHRGAVAVVDAARRVVRPGATSSGRSIARSAIKPLQALPLVESGAADAFGLGDRRDRAGLRLP